MPAKKQKYKGKVDRTQKVRNADGTIEEIKVKVRSCAVQMPKPEPVEFPQHEEITE